jgi:hypothetical protein
MGAVTQPGPGYSITKKNDKIYACQTASMNSFRLPPELQFHVPGAGWVRVREAMKRPFTSTVLTLISA